jgi:hypothetical protein
MSFVNVKIDNISLSIEEGSTILDVSKAAWKRIVPGLDP